MRNIELFQFYMSSVSVVPFYKHLILHSFYWETRITKGEMEEASLEISKTIDQSGIRTHASEETGALNQRLRPLGHLTTFDESAGAYLNCCCSSWLLKIL